ncbi:hypothetical protein CNE_BB2p00600 (plasmid) [Cupriavidus necator N-1]|uniref:Uncharacterized protein n=1 Tax=Cupriavidus necator (strain ATCC 43291 / DSM 13513 / CCUG 52238 / LMG 8453 / N-1) TaxID=1042878 RepID=F8GYD3_CUPNN|nr:hypothetical protein CNE_BB2p00600 [Cupriavidus necator N-1]
MRRCRLPDLHVEGRRLRARALLQHHELKTLVADWSDDDIQALNRAVLVQPSGLLASSPPKCRIASRRPVSR